MKPSERQANGGMQGGGKNTKGGDEGANCQDLTKC